MPGTEICSSLTSVGSLAPLLTRVFTLRKIAQTFPSVVWDDDLEVRCFRVLSIVPRQQSHDARDDASEIDTRLTSSRNLALSCIA